VSTLKDTPEAARAVRHALADVQATLGECNQATVQQAAQALLKLRDVYLKELDQHLESDQAAP